MSQSPIRAEWKVGGQPDWVDFTNQNPGTQLNICPASDILTAKADGNKSVTLTQGPLVSRNRAPVIMQGTAKVSAIADGDTDIFGHITVSDFSQPVQVRIDHQHVGAMSKHGEQFTDIIITRK